MRIGPFRFQFQIRFEFLNGLRSIAFVFERQSQVVMSCRVVGFEFEHFSVIHDCLIPGFGARKLQGALAIVFGRLRKGDRACEEAERQESEKGSHTSESISGRAYKSAHPARWGKITSRISR